MTSRPNIPPHITMFLRSVAEEECGTFVDMDTSGQEGFNCGLQAGRIELAQELCRELGIEFADAGE